MADTRVSALFRQGLFTDLYELTMGQAYHDEGMDRPAVFELFFRSMPPQRNYIMAAGLEEVLQYVEGIRFAPSDISYLREQRLFSEPFLTKLGTFQFTGDVYAVPEGTIVFPGEPVLQIIAPVAQAQLMETLAINQIHFQSLIATKASRILYAAQERMVVDFGSRRAHGTDAAVKAARASYLAGMAGTSNVMAGRRYDIPIFGTMAHSYVQAHESESAAFKAFAGRFPYTTLLVDTYDTLEGVRRVIQLTNSLGARFNIRAIRLDSGDLSELARQARRMLDAAGLTHIRIFASGGLDEHIIQRMIANGAPIDGFGVGTGLVTSSDSPIIETAYKLVEYDGRPTLKLSTGKVTHPGRKQVFRQYRDGKFFGDCVTLHDETAPGEALLRPVMRAGKRLAEESRTLDAARMRAGREMANLPERLRSLEPAGEAYRVEFSAALRSLRDELSSRPW